MPGAPAAIGALTLRNARNSTLAETQAGEPGLAEHSDKARMEALEARLAAAKAAQEPSTSRAVDHHSQAQLAWRMVIELVAGLGIGFGIGYGLDQLFGTGPWLMIVFVFLGLAAGVKTMMRSAEEVQAKRQAAEAAQTGESQDGG